MDHSIKVYWIFFSIGYCNCFPSISNQNEKQVIEGDSLNLTCQISSDVIHCAWFHTNEESLSLSSSNKPHYNIFGNHSNGECHLYINNAKLDTDNGLWTCQMTTINKLNISGQIHLTVLPHDNARIKGDSVIYRPGVFIGAFCAAAFTIGGLITIYSYKRKSPCCLARAGYSSRSMLIWNSLPQSSSPELQYENKY